MSRCVVITGAAGDLGRALTARFLAEGDLVFGADLVAIRPGRAMSRRRADPLRRLARMGEVVDAVRYLASDAASYSNGVIPPVYGGSYLP